MKSQICFHLVRTLGTFRFLFTDVRITSIKFKYNKHLPVFPIAMHESIIFSYVYHNSVINMAAAVTAMPVELAAIEALDHEAYHRHTMNEAAAVAIAVVVVVIVHEVLATIETVAITIATVAETAAAAAARLAVILMIIIISSSCITTSTGQHRRVVMVTAVVATVVVADVRPHRRLVPGHRVAEVAAAAVVVVQRIMGMVRAEGNSISRRKVCSTSRCGRERHEFRLNCEQRQHKDTCTAVDHRAELTVEVRPSAPNAKQWTAHRRTKAKQHTHTNRQTR